MARSLVALFFLVALPRVLAGQVDSARTDTTTVGVRLRIQVPPFVLQEPSVLRAPGTGANRLPPAIRAQAWDSAVRVVLDSTRQERAEALRYLNIYGTLSEPDTARTTETPSENNRVLGLAKKYADLGIDGQVRLEIRSDRLRNERCSPAVLLDPNSGCRGGFRAPRLDNQVNLRSQGIIGRRVHLNVDYDSERDFSGNNDVQIYYEGLQDEIIRRIEIGTVAFQPPQSRFITAAIPANNFGINASFEVGPIQLQALAATQKGSQVADRTYTVGQTTSQPQDRQVRDLDFETGRFFWVVDPAVIPGYPALDILSLGAAGLPAGELPAQVQVYRYRAALNRGSDNPLLGGITAVARTADGRQIQGPVRWEMLIQGTDYYLDPSGLWVALSTKLDQNDFLAVSYRTGAGVVVGSLPTDDDPAANDSLRLVVDPQKGPEFETFRREMRQIYRVAGTDLDPASLQVTLSLNRSERPQNGSGTYLGLLRLAIPTDPNILDRENRLFPRDRDPEAVPVVRESYIVFPHLTPFADTSRLTPAERSDSLYRTPLFLLLSHTPARFEMRMRYNSTGAGDRSTLSLGAVQIREESEQLFIRGRRLERGVDYSISYDLGQVTFLNPDALFGSGSAQVTARFEEQDLFAVAPTSIFGLATRYSLGETGSVNLIGMYQREQSAFNRPPLGFEAAANLVGGINTELRFKPQGITRLLDGLTTGSTAAPSLLDVNAEFAFTKPDPNRSGQAYLEEFEADAGIQVSLRESSWEFGSRPADPSGTEDVGFGGGFDTEDAVALTWQNLIPSANGGALELRPEDIDTLIRIVGRGEPLETPMFMTLHADTAGGLVQSTGGSRWSLPQRPFRPRWRSMVTGLSATGMDLTRNEYLEFWVFQPGTRTTDSAGVRLVFDIGTVNEDAIGIAPVTIALSGTDTSFAGRQLVGTGRLDTERSRIDVFNAEVDDVGILGDRPDQLIDALSGETLVEVPLCQRILTNAVPVFPWGDLSSRCSRGNGTLDSEDLNGDNVLNASGSGESVFRYIVSLQPGGKYYVRDGRSIVSDGLVSKWELYRIPIRTPDRTIGTPNLRLIQHLRMTVIAPPDAGSPDVVARFAMARLRFVGSPWIRRAESPIAGISGAIGKPFGEVIASVVSTENRVDLGYEPPPGVIEGVSRRGDVQASGTQVNEKSLRLIARQLDAGDRAEAYLRFPSGPQNLLNYRELRVWARGRGAGWEEGDLQAFIKLGSDNRNFYLYRSAAHSTTWEPEFIVNLDVWRALRAVVERRWLNGETASGADQCGGDPNAFVACDGPYLVHLADPGINPPNLASVQEMSAGIYRVAATVPLAEAELWVDDIRLDKPVSEMGTAIAFDTRLTASDIGTFSAAYSRQDGQFRQINSDPTYRTSGTLQLNSSWQLDRFLPTALGISLPLTVSYARNDVSPQLLNGSDLRGDELVGLRRPESWSTTYNLALRRTKRGSSWLTQGFLDPFAVSATLVRGRSQTELSSARSKASVVSLTYNLQMQRRGLRLPFGGIVKGLPKWIQESEGGKALESATLSLVPSNVRFSSGLTRDQGDYSSFAVPITRPSDALVLPTLSLNHLWRNSAGLTWQPLGMLALTGDLTSTRDLRVYPDSTPIGRLAYADRRFLLGVPVGVERDRTLITSLRLTPRLTSWLRPRFTTGSSFLLSRTLTSRPLVRADGDSIGAFILPTTLNNSRSREIGGSLDLARLLRQMLGDSSGIGNAASRIRPVDLSSQLTRSSTFDLTAFEPSLGYMLGLGGLPSFLSQQGSNALGASETRTATLSSGAELPLGFSATISYALTTTNRFQQLIEGSSETSSRQREWPVGSVRWNRTFKGGPVTLVAAGIGFRQREGQSTQPGGAGARATSATSSSSFTPDLQLSLRNGMALSLGFSSRSQRTENNGNSTLLDQDDLTASFNHSFRLPFSIGRTRKQVRSSLTALTSKSLSCLERRNELNCTATSDVRRQEVRGGLDTDLAQTLSGGLQFGYSINDARHLSRRTSHIFLMLSFQLSLYAGDYQ